MKKIEIIYEIMKYFGIFYPYLIKKVFFEIFNEKISESLILYSIKKFEKEGKIEKLFDLEFRGKFSWGFKVKRSIYISKDRNIIKLLKVLKQKDFNKLREIKKEFLLNLLDNIKNLEISEIKKKILIRILEEEVKKIK